MPALPVQRRIAKAPVTAPSRVPGIAVPSAGPPPRSVPAALVTSTRVQRRADAPPTARAAGPPGEAGRVGGSPQRGVEFDARKLTDRQVEELVERLSGPLTRLLRFDARKLPDGQVDELIHRLFGPLTRLLRTEFRLDRERIGKLRDARR